MSLPSLNAVATALVASGRATREAVPGLLYYARGVSLGLGRGRVFDGDLVAGPLGPTCSWAMCSDLERLPDPFDEVLDVFAGFAPEALEAAVRVERPWRIARARLAGDAGQEILLDRDLLAGFSQSFEWGEDVVHDLGMALPEGLPEWATWLRIAMNVGRFEGHPWFDDVESRRIRLAIGLGEYPDAWPSDGDGSPPSR